MKQYVLIAQPDEKKILQFFVAEKSFWTFSYEAKDNSGLRDQLSSFFEGSEKVVKFVPGFYESMGDLGFLSLVLLHKEDSLKEGLVKLSFSDLLKRVDPSRLRLVFLKVLQILSEANSEAMRAYEIKRKV